MGKSVRKCAPRDSLRCRADRTTASAMVSMFFSSNKEVSSVLKTSERSEREIWALCSLSFRISFRPSSSDFSFPLARHVRSLLTEDVRGRWSNQFSFGL